MTRRAAPLVLVLAAALGCRDRARAHHVDDLFLTPEQERDVFVASTDHLGPDTSVVVLADAPKARYEGGAIVLTGGREIEVVQPHAWRSSTGTALSSEEARRLIDRAGRLDGAMRDIGDAVHDLREYLEARTADAKRAAAQLDERDRRLDANAARAARLRDADTAAVVAARDRDLEACLRERDVAVARADGELARAQRELGEGFDRRAGEVAAAARRDDEALTQRQRLDAAAARDAGKDAAYLVELDRRHADERARAGEAQERARAALASERETALGRLRGERDTATAHAQRLADERAERIRRLSADHLSRIAAERERAARRSATLGEDGPWAGAARSRAASAGEMTAGEAAATAAHDAPSEREPASPRIAATAPDAPAVGDAARPARDAPAGADDARAR